MRLLRYIALFVVGFVVITLYVWFKLDYEHDELAKHGRYTKGLVIDHVVKIGVRTKIGDRAVIRFYANHKVYVEEYRDNKFRYCPGDSVKIKYSSEDPTIFRIVKRY